MDKEDCQHTTLMFASGAFYIICQECFKYWVAIGNDGDADIDYSRGNSTVSGQIRVEKKENV